jgi:hypothetical protein
MLKNKRAASVMGNPGGEAKETTSSVFHNSTNGGKSSTPPNAELCPHCNHNNINCYWCRGRGWLTHHEYAVWLSDQQTAMFGDEVPFQGEPVAPEPLTESDAYGLEPRR